MIAAKFLPRKKFTDSKGNVIYDWGTVRKGFTGAIVKRIEKLREKLWPGENVTRESLGIVEV